MNGLGRFLIIIGVVIVITGVLINFIPRDKLPLGRLPGDIAVKGKNFTFYFPFTTSVLLSAVISLVMFFIFRR